MFFPHLKFTNFFRTNEELEETILFTILVAGKNALTTAKNLDVFLKKCHKNNKFEPFNCLRKFSQQEIKFHF
jgi:hypothetical protein